MIIAIDFDGTCVTNEYPNIGRDIGAIPVLKELSNNHKLILYTMRSGKELNEAINYLTDNGIKLWSVNKNPSQYRWTSSPKIYANLYIDDASLGIPLKRSELSTRSYVDWDKVKLLLKELNII